MTSSGVVREHFYFQAKPNFLYVTVILFFLVKLYVTVIVKLTDEFMYVEKKLKIEHHMHKHIFKPIGIS